MSRGRAPKPRLRDVEARAGVYVLSRYEAEALTAAIHAVLALHGPDHFMGIPEAASCAECQSVDYPCPTVASILEHVDITGGDA